MTSNKHYFIDNKDNYVYLLNMSFNHSTNKVELQTLLTNRGTTFTSEFYSMPLDQYNIPLDEWYYLTNDNSEYISLTPGFKIHNNSVADAIGFSVGNYPSQPIVFDNSGNNSQTYTDDLTFTSSSIPGSKPTYVPIYYKPNNPQFAVQGAVDASTRTARNRYNTITNNTAVYNNAYGLSVANALAYGVPSGGYTWKDKIGYPTKQTPVISKYTGEMKKCDVVKISGV
jgi:hypothetical protein